LPNNQTCESIDDHLQAVILTSESYKNLCKEIEEEDAHSPSYNPQSLQYLDAIIREGLRISMANPTRVPRVTPPQGFNFTLNDGRQIHIPAGTLVSLQIYTLHFNAAVFPDPFAFKPERWLNKPTPEMQRDFIPFGLGPRQCIARNLATQELFLAVRAMARERLLAGARPIGEKIEILEWFNSRVVGEKIEIAWE
jgi:cytochrome P450